jgi:hypothetical protein
MKKKEILERIVDFEPAYDKRDKGCGIGSVRIRFVLKGKQGAVQLLLGTNWYTNTVDYDNRDKLSAWDLGYHSRKPRYKGHKRISKKCCYLNNRPCYYGGSGLNAKPYLEILINKGSKGVWKELEHYYWRIFNKD